MFSVPTKVLLIGQNETMVDNVKKIIPRAFATASCHPEVDEVSREIVEYRPDIAILCLDIDVAMDVEAYGDLSSLGAFDEMSVIVIGQVDECRTFENSVFLHNPRILQRPIKGSTLSAVLKKCEEEQEKRLIELGPEKIAERANAPDSRLDRHGAEYRGGEYRGGEYRGSEYDSSYYQDENGRWEERRTYFAQTGDERGEMEKEIIKIPPGSNNGHNLHSDDILRIPPEKGRYFRNAVREKQIKRVQTVFEEDEPQQRLPTHISGKFSVLVVDDDVQILGAVRKYLQNEYFVTTVPSGKMAYKFLEVNVVDVILLDYLMRDEDGPSVMKTLRNNTKTANTPVIFLTGVSDKERVMNVLSLHPQGYLLKPIQKQELTEAIEKVLK